MKTKVKFLYHEPETENSFPDIFAYFPEIMHSETMATSYATIGQHSACSQEYADECRNATEQECKALKIELESIGYEIEIIK